MGKAMEPKGYQTLLQNYTVQIISTEQFEIEYLESFKNESGDMDKRLFDILEDLFEDLDAYSPMWTLEDEKDAPYRITEVTLRKEVVIALQKLEDYFADQNKNAA
jgi:hypothetical protein